MIWGYFYMAATEKCATLHPHSVMNKQESHPEQWFQGVPISPGIACARVCLFCENESPSLPTERTSGRNYENEFERFQSALATVSLRLDEVKARVAKEIGPAEAEIFTTQQMILQDEQLIKSVVAGMQTDNLTCETAVHRTLSAFENRLRAVASDTLRERASDISEVKRRLLEVLGHGTSGFQCSQYVCRRGRGRIVAARELTPRLTVDLDTEHVQGFVTDHGGLTSHAAILARALGIPAVSGIPKADSVLTCGAETLINGNTGEVILWPSAATKARYPVARTFSLNAEPCEPIPGLKVYANINLVGDMAQALQMKAEGIGLYRTEFEFLAESRALSEEEQFQRYSAVLRAFPDQPVHFRLLDLGGDKSADFLELSREDNPALGLRGARLLMARPDLLRTQVRAIARASHVAPLNLLYPMITDAAQFLKLRAQVEEIMAPLRPGAIRHGVMLEVPSACLNARDLLKVADFASLGTNDLYQYLFALDRNNEQLAEEFKHDHPVFWSLIRDVARIAQRLKKPLSVCGEIAGQTDCVLKLQELGIDTVSIPPRLIPRLRRAVAAALYSRKKTVRTPKPIRQSTRNKARKEPSA
jgi:phosphotransferase system enzyme I (PtsI)